MMSQSSFDEVQMQALRQQTQTQSESAYARQTASASSASSRSFAGADVAFDSQQQEEVSAEFDAYAAAAAHANVHSPPPSSATLASAAVQRHAAAAASASRSPSLHSSFSSPSSSSSYSSAGSRRDVGPSGVSLGSRLSFAHGVRLALALAPALVVVLAAGGKPLLLLLCVSAISAYVIDSLGSPEGAFVCVWVGCVGGMGSLALSNALKDAVGLWSTLLLVHCNVLLLFAALAITLCQAFMVQELLERRVERMLFGAAFMPIVTVELLAAVSALGVHMAPWALCAIIAYNYALLLTPLPSSQQMCELGLDQASIEQGKRNAAGAAVGARPRPSHLGGASVDPSKKRAATAPALVIPVSEMDTLVSPLLSGVYTLLSIALPYFLFLALHHAHFSTHFLAAEGLLLLTTQVLVLAAIMKEDLLWFTGLSVSAGSLARRVLVVCASLLLVLLLEVRVVLPVFGHLLYLRHSWPLLCFVVLTVGMLAAMGALALLYLGVDKQATHSGESSVAAVTHSSMSSRRVEPARVTLFKTLLHVSAVCVGISLGVPLYGYVFLLVLAWCASLVLLQQHPLAFAVATALWSLGAYVLVARTVGFLEFGIREREQAHDAAQYMFSSQAHMLWILASLALFVPACHLGFAWLGAQLAGASLRIDAGLLGLPPVEGRLVVRFLYLLADSLACLYVLVLAALEWDWTRMDRRSLYDSPVYAWYLVLATSALGVALAYQLSPRRMNRIAQGTFVALVVLNVWKAGVLFFDDQTDLWHFLAFVAVQVPLYLADDARAAERAAVGASAASPPAPFQRTSVRAGVAHAVAVVAVMWTVKNTILAHALHASGLQSLTSSASATESTYVALFLVGSSVGLLPLSFQQRYFRSDPRWRRWNVLALLLSLLFFVIQPRLDFLGGLFALDAHSDVFTLGMEVVTPRWPAWLLYAALATLLLSVTSVGAQMATANGAAASAGSASMAAGSFVPRPLLALALGSSLGIYLIGVYLPWNLPLYALLLTTFNLAAVFLIYLFIRGGGGGGPRGGGAAGVGLVDTEGGMIDSLLALFSSAPPGGHASTAAPTSSLLLPAVYCALVALLPVSWLAIAWVYSAPQLYGASTAGSGRGGRGGAGVVGGAVASAVASIADVRTLYRVALLSLHAALHFLLALAVNLQRELAISSQSREGRYKNLQQYGMGALGAGARRHGSGALGAGSVQSAGSPLLFLGNVATLLSLACAVYLNLTFLDGSVLCVFALSPMLLLLNQDSSASFRHLSHERRWWPVLAAVVALLLWTTALDVGVRSLLAPLGLVAAPNGSLLRVVWWWRIKNAALACLTLPSLHSFLSFLWHARSGSGASSFSLLLLAPLCLLPLLLADLANTQLLAGVALAGIIVEAVAVRKRQRAGMRLI